MAEQAKTEAAKAKPVKNEAKEEKPITLADMNIAARKQQEAMEKKAKK